MSASAAHRTAPVTAPTLGQIVSGPLASLARTIDDEGFYPQDVMTQLGVAGAYGHHAGPEGLPLAVQDMALVGTECGSTAFCTWCQDALAWYLAASDNADLRARLLPRIASGAQLGGTGLSNPMKALSGLDTLALKGTRVTGGWRVTGKLPWVSNLGPDHLFASIFAVGEQKVMAVFDCAQEGIQLADGGHFIALEGTRTYSVLIRDAFVPDEMVLSEDAASFVPKIRQGFVLLQMGMAIGAARAAAAQMRIDGGARKILADLPLGADAIDARAEALLARVAARSAEALDPGRPAFLETLRLRLDGSRLALDAAEANLIAHGARGYLKGSRPSRLQREAHFVAIVSPSIKHILTELGRG